MATGAAVLAVGVAKHKAEKRAQKKDQRAVGVEQRLAEIQNARQRRQLVAQAQQARAQVEAEAASSGVSGASSGAAGGIASIQSQLFSELGFSQVQEQAGKVATNLRQKAQRSRAGGATAGAIAALPGQLGFTPSIAGFFQKETPAAPKPTPTNSNSGSSGFLDYGFTPKQVLG